MGITFGDYLIDSGYYDITPEQEREMYDAEEQYQIEEYKARIADLEAQIAAKDEALRLVDEALTAHETRTGKLHDMVLEARDAIRPNLEPNSPAWLREAFDKLHAIHHGMGGDPLVMHVRAALSQPATAQGCEHCKDYIGKCPYCHSERPGIPATAQGDMVRIDPEARAKAYEYVERTGRQEYTTKDDVYHIIREYLQAAAQPAPLR